MEETKRNGGVLFLFLIPTLAIFCGFFLPLAEVASYPVFRGKELFELYWHGLENAPPAAGFGLLVSLFRAIPFLTLPVMAVAALGWKETPYAALGLAAACLFLTLGLALPGYEPLVALANPDELGMPAIHPGLGGLLRGGYVGVGFVAIAASSLLLLAYSLYFIVSGGRGAVAVEEAVRGAVRRNLRQSMTVVALLGIWAIFYAVTENGVFMTPRNLSNLFLQSAPTAVIAMGVVLLLVTMNIDLSIGSVVGFVGAVAAVAQVDSAFSARVAGLLGSLGIPLDFMAVVGVLAGLLAGWLIGLWHGLWIAYMGVPALIVTLSGMMVFRGGLLYFTGGKSVANMYPWFKRIGMDYVSPAASVWIAVAVVCAYLAFGVRRRLARRRYGFRNASWPLQIAVWLAASLAVCAFFGIMIRYRGIPYAWLIVLAVMALFTFIAEKTTFGRHLYAIGGNPEAARLSGIDIRRKILCMYMLTGTLVAVGGIIYLSRIDSATANAGAGLELDCIASAVIGGTSLLGGEGYIYGGVVGALVMGSLDNGMTLMSLDATWQYVVKGLVLLLAVWVDMLTRRRGA